MSRKARKMNFSKIQNEILNSQSNLIVSAGAGSGKTRVLVEKYLKVFENWPDLKTDQVVAITFTEKAAQEMKNRIMQSVEERLKSGDEKFELYTRLKRELPLARISTIHSFCSRLIKESTLYAKVDPDFRIVNGISSTKRTSWFVESYVSENLNDMKEFFDIVPTLSFSKIIEWLKEGISLRASGKIPSDVDEKIREVYLKHLDRACEEYKKLSIEESALDFEDLLIMARDLLKENEELRQKYGNYFKYIFVDEFQDTNTVQSEIIELLRTKDNRVWYIGDPKQSIYAFRGADVEVFLNMKENIAEKNLELKEMNENYRSSPNLVEFYNLFFPRLFSGKISYTSQIKKNESDNEKRVIFLENPEKEKAEDARAAEAESISALISDFIAKGYKFKDIAVLVRSGGAIWQIEKALLDKGIPSYVIGGKEFFTKEEVRAIYNLIRVVLDPYDTGAMSGFLLSPFVRLSIDELLKLKLTDANLYDGLGEKYPHVKELIRRLMALKNTVNASKIIKIAIRETNYLGKLAIERDGDKKVANVMKFLEMMDSLDAPLWDVNGAQRIMKKGFDGNEEEAPALAEDADVVKIMNVHRSKGLEFPIVIIAQMAKETVNKKKKDEEIEEEKRILYVAMTRAKEYLILSKENSRNRNNKKSEWLRFLKETGLLQDNRWTIPEEMQNLVEIVKEPEFKPFEKNGKISSFELNDEYFETPKLETKRKFFSTTELFEKAEIDPAPEIVAYGNIAHAILEKVGKMKLTEALDEKTFLKYPGYMVETVKKTLISRANDLLIKEIENSDETKSEFAVQGSIPSLDVQLLGKIDKIIKTPDGYKIIDFKYSNYNRAKIKDYEFQISLYMFLYRKLTGRKTTGVVYFLKDGKELRVEEPNEDKMVEEIEKRVKSFQES